MKKIISTILMILMVFSLNLTFAKENENTTFNVYIESNILGETSNIKLSFISLPFFIDNEANLSINFPSEFDLPESISINSVIIDTNLNPVNLSVFSNTVLIKLPVTNLNTIYIEFLKSAQIKNPIEQIDKLKILAVFEENNFFIESNSLLFKQPENSILLDREVKIITTSGWIPEEFNLSLSSNLSDKIYYSLDNDQFKIYKNPIQITNGTHELKYYGVRFSGANEIISSTKFYVDAINPAISLFDPQDGSTINELNPELIFEVKDFSPVTIFIGENKTAIEESGYAKLKVALKPGENSLEAIAIDSANHKEYLKFTIYVDITPPTLVILSPKNKETICGDFVEIIGKAEIGSNVLIENYNVKIDTYGNFNFKYFPIIGHNKITVKAIDKAKNEKVEYLEFYYRTAIFIEFLIGKNRAIVDNKEVEISPSPFLDSKSGEIYLPLRFISNTLGYDLQWNTKESYAILSFKENEAIIRPNDRVVKLKNKISEKETILNNPPTIYKNSIVIPSEFLNKILDATLFYDPIEGKVIAKFSLSFGGEI